MSYANRNRGLLIVCVTAGTLFAAPAAFAACAISAAPNVVNCNAATLTTNSINTNATLPLSSDRVQEFTAGNITATIQSGVAITGAGLAIQSNPGSGDIDFTNLGSVLLTTTPATGLSTAALGLVTVGGAIRYSGTGTINTGGVPAIALGALTGGTGTISLVTDGTVISDGAAAIAASSATGTTSITANAAVSAAGTGITVTTSGGSINVNGSGQVVGDDEANGFGRGVDLRINGGPGSIDINLTGIVSSSEDAIRAIIGAGGTGNATVTVNNNVTGSQFFPAAGENGVEVATVSGTARVNVTAGIIQTSVGNRGIEVATASGAIVVNMTGGQIATAATRVGTGILANGGSGVDITASDIFATGNGIIASAGGSASLNVTTITGTSVSATTGTGMTVETNTGSLTVTINGTLVAQNTGIDAVINSGASTAALTLNINNALTAGQRGLEVDNSGSGAVNVNVNANVTGTAVFGMVLSGTNKTVTVASAATVTGLFGVSATGSTSIANSGSIVGTGGTAILLTGANNLVQMIGPNATMTGNAFGGGTATFRFAGTGANSFNMSQIAGGFALLDKTGAGTWTLTGATALPAATVSQGTLLVNGVLTAPIAVATGATLGGGGTVGATTVNGVLSPGNSIGTINTGSVTFNAGSTYAVEIDATLSDHTNVTGTATINAGTVQVTALAVPKATPYTILTSSGATTGTFTSATSNQVFVQPVLSYDAQHVYLTVTANFAAPGATPNQTVIGTALNTTTTTPYGSTLLALQTAADAQAALDQLSGEGHASIKGAFLLNSEELRQAVYDRIAAASSAVPPVGATGLVSDPAAPNAKSKTLWGGPFGNYGFIAGNGNAADTRALSGGIQLGGDAQMGSLILGGTGALGITMIDARNLSGRSADATAGIYAGGEVGPVELAIGAGYTRHFIDTTRTVTLPGVNDTYTATYQAGTAQAFAKAAVGLPVGSMTVTPFGAAAVVSHATDGFTEVGSGPGALSSAANVITGFVTTLGIGGEHKIAMANGMMTTIKASAGWQHSTLPAPTATNAFATGTPFTVSGAPIAADAVAVAVSSVTDLGQGIVLSLNYDGQIARASQSHSGKITLAGSF